MSDLIKYFYSLRDFLTYVFSDEKFRATCFPFFILKTFSSMKTVEATVLGGLSGWHISVINLILI